MIQDLLMISLFVTLVWNTDFFPTVDKWVSKKVRFHHLPKPFLCSLCGCWWLSLLYIVITGNITIPAILLCIINAYLTNIWIAVWGMTENIVFKIIEIINRLIDKI